MLARGLDRVLQAATVGLLAILAVVVVVAVACRYGGVSLIWYDEVASLLLAWLTFVGMGLAALRNAHLGFNGLLFGAPPAVRGALFVVVEIAFHASFAAIAWASWAILEIFGTESLTSLPDVPLWASRAVLPVSAVVIMLARALTTPERWRQLMAGRDPDSLEIEGEIARATRDGALSGERP